jgi:hypothetical protein
LSFLQFYCTQKDLDLWRNENKEIEVGCQHFSCSWFLVFFFCDS